jgi:hypothetical protein
VSPVVQPYQAGYGVTEFSKDVVSPAAEQKTLRSRRFFTALVVAGVAGLMLLLGIGTWGEGVSSVEEYNPGPVVIEMPGPAVPADDWAESGTDYSDQDLRDTDWSNMTVIAATFEGADLRGATFVDAILTASDFTEADLRGANMSQVVASGATFEDADLRGANLSGSSFSGANLEEADLRGANLGGVNFSGANLADVDLAGATYDAKTIWPTGFIVPGNAVEI